MSSDVSVGGTEKETPLRIGQREVQEGWVAASCVTLKTSVQDGAVCFFTGTVSMCVALEKELGRRRGLETEACLGPGSRREREGLCAEEGRGTAS